MARTAKAKNTEAESVPAEEAVLMESEISEAAEPEEAVELKAEEKPVKREYTEAEIQAIVAAAVKNALAEQKKADDPDGMVTLLFLGGIAPGTTVTLDGMGRIPRDGNTLTVTKRDFFQNLGAQTDLLLRKRKLIVTDGLTDEERERYGVLYKDNELLSATVYQKLPDYDTERLSGIYEKLCPEHRELVRRVLHTGAMDGDWRVSVDKLKAIIRIDRAGGLKGTPLEEDLKRLAGELD